MNSYLYKKTNNYSVSNMQIFIRIGIVLFGILITTGGVFYYNQSSSMHTQLQRPQDRDIRQSVPPLDFTCNGVKDRNYNTEHIYKGNIKPHMAVQVVLSCDHTLFTISGDVEQVIDGKALEDPHGGGYSINELADLSGGDLVVDFNSDYNFDGYNDLSSISSHGQGFSAVVSFLIFLYDPLKKQFVLNNDLTLVDNLIEADTKSKQILSEDCGFEDGGFRICKKNYYKWSNSKLVKVKTETKVLD